jgi:hypothetical protein
MSAKLGILIYKLLDAAASVTAYTSKRIYPNVAPLNEAQTFPYIVYKLISVEPTDTKGNLAQPGNPVSGGPKNQISPLDVVQYQVSCFTDDYQTGADLSHEIRKVLDRGIGSGFIVGNSPVIDSIIFDGETSMYEKDIKPEGVYHIAQTYSIRTINTWAQAPWNNTYSTKFSTATADMVVVGNQNIFSFGDGATDSPFSFSFWFKPDMIVAAQGFIGKSSFGNLEYEIRFGSAAVPFSGFRVRFYDNNTIGKYIQTTLNITFVAGTWYHIAVTYDGSSHANGQNIYVDTVVPSNSKLTQAGYVAMSNTPSSLLFGRCNNTFYDGNLEEIALFDHELSASDVLAIYNGGTPTDLTNHLGLIGWWRMGDSGGYPIINDNSINTNDALTVGAQFVQEVPV